MRRCFIGSMQQREFDVIGQVRIDTRLDDEPPPGRKGQWGHPRIGEKAVDLSMNSVKPRHTSVNNEATNLVRAGKYSSNGAGLL
jgi:hypothetical protein